MDTEPVQEKYIAQADRRQAKADGLLGDPARLAFPARTSAEFDAAVIRLNSIGGKSSPRYAGIKRNLIRIAAKQGYSLPDAWKTDSQEAAEPPMGTDGENLPIGAPDVQEMHNQVVALGARCMGLPWACDDDWLDALATNPTDYLLNALHTALCDMGAECAPPAETITAAEAREAGRRNSNRDQAALDRAHAALVEAGAYCKGMEAAKPAAPTADRERLTESAGQVRIHEAGRLAEAAFDAAKGEVTLTIIRPGFNTSQSRYYTAGAVASIAEAMQGVKMYLDHPTAEESRARPERSLADWTATLTETRVDPDGVARGKATITNPAFLQVIERLAATGLLAQLGASINAVGVGSKALVEGVETFRVERIDEADPFRSVDWVTEPGAGGRAELLEAAGHAAAPAATTPAAPAATEEQETIMENEQVTALAGRIATLEQALQAATARIEEAARGAAVDQLLAGVSGLTAELRAAVRPALIAGEAVPTRESVLAAVAAERSRAAAILGSAAGVSGFGATPVQESADPDADLARAFEAAGLSAAEITIALRGR